MILGILGIVLFIFPYIAIGLSILAIVFYTKQKESAMSKTGLVLGIIGIVINAVMLIILAGALLFVSAIA